MTTPETLRAVFTNEVIRAIGALARQREVCREQGGKTVFVSGMDAAREYLIEHALLAAAPSPHEDTYRWGEKMPQYAVLGIGAEAWVELQQAEECGVTRKFAPTSGVTLNWRTFQAVMNVLRAIRLKDFQAAATPAPHEHVCDDTCPANAYHYATGAPLASHYIGDSGSEREWRQCRWCGGYAEGPLGSAPSKHVAKDGVMCPLATLAAAAPATETEHEEIPKCKHCGAGIMFEHYVGCPTYDALATTTWCDDQIHEDAARLFDALCTGDGEHSEDLDRKLIEAQLRATAKWAASPERPDRGRLQQQALFISEILHHAGIGPCALTEGVLEIVRQRDELAALSRSREGETQ